MVKGKEKIVFASIDKLEEPNSLILFSNQVESLVPNTDLPGRVLKIMAFTKFSDQVTHISQGSSSIKDLSINICVVLITKACSSRFGPVVQLGIACEITTFAING